VVGRLLRNGIIAGVMVFANAVSAAELVCNSSDGEYHLCPLANADKLKVKIKYHSDGDCKKGDTWGVESKGIWVDLGCQATFRFKDDKSAQNAGWKRFLPSWVR
jgi:hypothetical protein